MLIELEEFKRLYPIGDILGQGAYGTVYESGDNAVKIISKPDDSFANFSALVEVDVYSRLRHPCILPLLNYAIDGETFLLAFPLAIEIAEALDKGLITKQEVRGDIINALFFLHSGGVAHRDIKSQNVLFYNGHAVLIDFGIAEDIINTYEGQFIKGEAYSGYYRDPQYDTFEYNSIKVELYATGKLFERLEIPGYSILLNKIHERPPLDKLFDIYNVEFIPGEIKTVETVPPLKVNSNDITQYAAELLRLKIIRAKDIFFCLHVYHRLQYDLIEKYSLREIAKISLYVSSFKLGYFEIEYIERFDILYDALKSLHGIITTPSLWDYIKYDNCIHSALIETLSDQYSYPFMRCIGSDELKSNSDIHKYGLRIDNKDILKLPVRRDIDPVIYPFKDIIREFDFNLILRGIERVPELYIPKLYYYAEDLEKLNERDGKKLYNILLEKEEDIVKDFLAWFFRGNYKVNSNSNGNPFKLKLLIRKVFT